MQLLTGLWQTLGRLTGVGEQGGRRQDGPAVPASPAGLVGIMELLRLLNTYWLSGRIAERRKRLFACACCRVAWPWLEDPRSQEAVRMSERLADGLVTREEARPIIEAALGAAADTEGLTGDPDLDAGIMTSRGVAAGLVEGGFLSVLLDAAAMVGTSRDVWSNVYHDLFDGVLQTVMVPRAWLEWNNGTVVRVARVIYEERQFADLAILADALEEAGCTAVELLTHLRSSGPHFLGCWALDAVLGKA